MHFIILKPPVISGGPSTISAVAADENSIKIARFYFFICANKLRIMYHQLLLKEARLIVFPTYLQSPMKEKIVAFLMKLVCGSIACVSLKVNILHFTMNNQEL